MDLKNLNDQILLGRTFALASREREITLEILHHLKEIERRRLFSTLGCSSLFEYCTEKLGYSEGSAQRRIQAMRALRDLPAIESKIESGALTLSNLARAQTLFSHQKKSGNAYSSAEKLNFLGKLEDKSAREADRVIAHVSPALCHQEKVRTLTGNQNELKTIVDDEFLELLETLKGRLAHKSPGASTSELLKFALKAAVNQLNAQNRPKRQIREIQPNQPDPPWTSAVNQDVVVLAASNKKSFVRMRSEVEQVFVPPTSAVKQTWRSTFADNGGVDKTGVTSNRNDRLGAVSRAIPSSISAILRREVWRRAANKCENCRSRYALEVDHLMPRAFGGGHTSENLRLLCRPCNQGVAIEKLGLKKMNPYLSVNEQK